MSNLLQFMGSPLTSPPKVIVNHCSDGTLLSAGVLGTTYTNCLMGCLADKILSGALTANTYKEVLSVAGAGVIDVCAVVALDVTSRTLGLKLTIDGVDVFSAISAATTITKDGLLAVGVFRIDATATFGSVIPQSRIFYSSLSVSIRSSISETDKIAALVDYYTI